MREKYRSILMWALYGLFFLLIAVLQSVIFGKARFFSVKLALIPVTVACTAIHTGAEGGALYGLVCGTLWCFAGADGGALHIVLLCLTGALCGYLCESFFTRSFLPALMMSLLALCICQGVFFLFQCFIGAAVLSQAVLPLRQIGLSSLSCLLLNPAAKAIRKAGN